MPNDEPQLQQTFGATANDTPSMATARMGDGPCWPLPTAQGNYKYAVVAIDYFTKWIEAKPLVNIISEAV